MRNKVIYCLNVQQGTKDDLQEAELEASYEPLVAIGGLDVNSMLAKEMHWIADESEEQENEDDSKSY